MGVIVKYKFNQNVYANLIPEFNGEFTNYTITDKTDTDGYTIRTIESDSLPKLMRFGESTGQYEVNKIGAKAKSLKEVLYADMSNVERADYMFGGCINLTKINTEGWNNNVLTDIHHMFFCCKSLENLDVTGLVSDAVSTISFTFYYCAKLYKLIGLESWDTSNVTTMYNVFQNCFALTSLNVSNWHTAKVTNMNNMFQSCTSLTSLDLSSFDTSNVISMFSMFYNCSSLTSLDTSNWDTSQVTTMEYMFYNCQSLTSLDLSNFNTSKVDDLGQMFQNCTSLTSLDLSSFDTSNVISMFSMFYNCSSLTTLDLSNFNTSKVTNTTDIFTGITNLTDIGAIYCNSLTINTISSLITTNTTVWYSDTKLSDLASRTNITFKEYRCAEVQQDVDSIPLTSDMFEQGNIASGKIVGMSYQQLKHTTETIRVKSKTLIPIKPNGKYIIQNLNKTNNRVWGWQYDKNGGYLSSIGATANKDVFQFDSKAHYITFVLCNQDDSAISPLNIDSLNLILQEVPQEIVLRGIGDVKDELDLTRGEYIQRIGEIKFNECQYDFSQEMIPNSCAAVFYPNPAKQKISSYNLKCDKLPTVGGIVGDVAIYENPGNIVIFDKTISSQQEFIQKYNDCTIQYVLATPIIHKVNLTNTKVIQSYATETHYETITPSDSLIPNITIPSTLNYDVAIKPSTEYTIRANTSDNLTVDLGGATGTLSNGKVTLTTPATLTHNEVKFSGTGKVKELMVVEGNEIKDNVPFFNGMKNVQMGGIKLVNIARGATCNNLVTANTNKTQFTYTSDGTNWGDVLFDKSLLKQNTLYTIYINVISSNSDNANPLKISMGDDLNTWLNVSSTGLFKQTFTTNDNIDNLFGINFRPCTSGQKVVIQNPMIIEGDWTHLDEIPFIESEMIIEQPIIRSQGKNLFDVNKLVQDTNDFGYNSGGYRFPLINFKVGKIYTISVSEPKWIKIGEFSGGVTIVENLNTTKLTITMTNDILKSYVMVNNNDYSVITDVEWLRNNIQIEEGSTATPHEPYKHQTLYSNRVIGYEDGCYYTWDTGTKESAESIASVMSDVEGLNVAYVTHASSNFSFYDKDGVYLSGSMYLSTATDFDKFGFIKIPANAKYMKMGCGNANSAVAKDYHLKATVTGELPLRSLPNGVCDTLNLVTGEYVQNIKEVVIDGSEDWFIQEDNTRTEKTIYCRCISFPDSLPLPSDWDNNAYNVNLNCDNLTVYSSDYMWKNEVEGISRVQSSRYLRIRLNKNKLDTPDLAGFKQYLSQNPITVQYQLEIPIVRKLGFTTKGNYAGITLNGGEDLYVDGNINNADTARFEVKVLRTGNTVYYDPSLATVWFDNFDSGAANTLLRGQVSAWSGDSVMFALSKYSTNVTNLQEFTQWLGLNSGTLGFLTKDQSSESYSNIHKPIFFNNVDVQFLPHNLEIQPQLTLQARTRNSYVMDMMKANTKYSIKLLTYSGAMLIEGTHYALANNITFVTPSTLTNKELIITSQWYEPMIIEGDVTGKNLPYFKGILSSYHDVDEIEIDSISKNLFDMSKVTTSSDVYKKWETSINPIKNEIISKRITNDNQGAFPASIRINVKPTTRYCLRWESDNAGMVYVYSTELWDTANQLSANYGSDGMANFVVPSNVNNIEIGLNYGDFNGSKEYRKIYNIALYEVNELQTVKPPYIPHAHNTTLIEMPTRLETVKVVRPVLEKGQLDRGNGQNYNDDQAFVRTKEYIPVTQGEVINIQNANSYRAMNIIVYDINKSFVQYIYTDGSGDVVIPKNGAFVRCYCGVSATSDLTITRQEYKPIQLNSLPNGVCDEIIMKPNSNKAQLVQRVGKVVLDGSEDWIEGNWNFNDIIQMEMELSNSVGFNNNMMCESIKVDTFYNLWQQGNQDVERKESITIFDVNKRLILALDSNKFGSDNINDKTTYVRQNPITVYYELATPIIHEIQLKGYPHVYENGTVTLNTDIPHQTLVSYNVNQEQLINTQNETIIRHDQQIDDLYYYIEMYLEEIYQMELFRMKLELSL